MFARVNISQVKPDKFDEAERITEEIVLPAAREQRGFKGYLGLADPETGKSIAMTFWETEADRDASGQASPYFKELMSKMVSIFSVPPVSENFEVLIQELDLLETDLVID